MGDKGSPDMIQSEIPFDEIREVVGIARLPAVRHGEVRSERFDLVLIGFHLDDRSPGRLVGSEEDVVLA